MLLHNSPLIIACLPHFYRNGLCADRKIISKTIDRISGNTFVGSWWPLLLELNHIGKLPRNWGDQTLPASIRTLTDAKVSIINWGAQPRVFDIPPDESISARAPSRAIEHLGSDYRDEESAPESLHSLVGTFNPFSPPERISPDDGLEF
jgi:hypothetical protein